MCVGVCVCDMVHEEFSPQMLQTAVKLRNKFASEVRRCCCRLGREETINIRNLDSHFRSCFESAVPYTVGEEINNFVCILRVVRWRA